MANRQALLVMDMQTGLLTNYPQTAEMLDRTRRAIEAARSAGVPVLYAVLSFRPGFPEIDPANKMLGSVRDRIGNKDPAAFATIHPTVAPRENEVVVQKKRVSAFTGSDLEVVLRAQGIRHLALCGISTSGVVLSTLREAADKDFFITVLADGCFDADEEVHRVLTTKIFLRQATVTTCEAWAASLQTPRT